jgi:hypothetical protein
MPGLFFALLTGKIKLLTGSLPGQIGGRGINAKFLILLLDEQGLEPRTSCFTCRCFISPTSSRRSPTSRGQATRAGSKQIRRAKITELPAIERANGKPAFLRFAFENPRKAQQAYEVGALGVDSDKDGNDFVLDVVMSGNSKAALDRADAAYTAFLKAH